VEFAVFSGSLAVYATSRRVDALCSASSVASAVFSGSPADWRYP